MHVFTAQPLVLVVSLASSKSSSRNMWSPLAITLGCPALARPQTRQKLLWLNPVLRHCVQYVLSLTAFRALASLCPIIILLSADFSAIPALSLQTLVLAWATIPLASSSFKLVIALACLTLSELLSLFTGFLLTLRSTILCPSERFRASSRPSRSSSLALSFGSYLLARSRPRDSLFLVPG